MWTAEINCEALPGLMRMVASSRLQLPACSSHRKSRRQPWPLPRLAPCLADTPLAGYLLLRLSPYLPMVGTQALQFQVTPCPLVLTVLPLLLSLNLTGSGKRWMKRH